MTFDVFTSATEFALIFKDNISANTEIYINIYIYI